MLEITNHARGVVPASSLILVLLAISGALLSEKPFQSARPDVASHSNSDVEKGQMVRPWEDPFFLRSKLTSVESANDLIASNPKINVACDNKILKHISDDYEQPIRRINKVCNEVNERAQNNSVTILINLVIEGDEPSVIEDRRRERLAMGHALTALGLTPETPGKLDYFYTLNSNSEHSDYVSHPSELSVFVPYEWYQNGADQTNPTLVLWVEDSDLVKPAWVLGNLVNLITGGKREDDKINVRIVGPSSSSVLGKLYEDWTPSNRNISSTDWAMADFQIFSHRATVDNTTLFKSAGHKPRFLYRTIATDEDVTVGLIEEFAKRSIALCNTETSILLILESDDIYGLDYEEAFRDKLNEHCSSRVETKIASITVARYFSVIDGKLKTNTHGQQGANNQPDLLRQAVGGDMSLLDTSRSRQTERPTGAHQLDYIRRMAKQLSREDEVDIIGIVGADVYDKLLIIQAIRAYLKRPLIFTTDASALYEQPQYASYTKNLLIGSGHGLNSWNSEEEKFVSELCSSLKATSTSETSTDFQMLRFRDNYQTSYFRAVSFALCSKDINPGLLPETVKLFEVGRSGLTQLVSESDNFRSFAERLRKTLLDFEFWLRVVFLLAPLLLLQLYLLHRRRCAPLGSQVVGHGEIRTVLNSLLRFNIRAISILLLFLCYIRINPFDNEHIILFEGISAIPAFTFRISAFVLAICLTTYGIVLLSTNLATLKKYFSSGSPTPAIDDRQNSEINKQADTVANNKNPLAVPLLRIKHGITKLVSPIREQIPKILSIGIWEQELHCNLTRSNRATGEQEWSANSADHIWHTYSKLGSVSLRLWRTLPAAVIAIGFMWYVVLGHYEQPHLLRAANLDLLIMRFDLISFTTKVAVSFTIFAIFLAGDALKLCTTFVKHHQFDYIAWPTIPNRSIYAHLTPYAGFRMASLEIIMRRTEVFSTIILFPFLVLFLLVMARSNIFDGWTWNAGVLAVYGYLSIYILYRSAMLQRAANHSRSKIFSDLNRELSKIKTGVRSFASNEDRNNAKVNLEEAIDYVANLNRGLFSNLITHPLFQAIAWPSTAVGLITLTQLLW